MENGNKIIEKLTQHRTLVESYYNDMVAKYKSYPYPVAVNYSKKDYFNNVLDFMSSLSKIAYNKCMKSDLEVFAQIRKACAFAENKADYKFRMNQRNERLSQISSGSRAKLDLEFTKIY
jgi:hypothetical protein